MTSSIKLVVIDYQSGNLRSVAKALETAGVYAQITGDPAQLRDADAVILPGVGSGPAAMAALRQRGLVEPLRQYVASGRPFLGVCLGLQLLLERTQEGDTSGKIPFPSPNPFPLKVEGEDGGGSTQCLGIIPGEVQRLPQGLKVPHMGWNSVEFKKPHPVFQDIPQESHFYFVHSYYAAPQDGGGIAGITEYGIPFCSVYARGNLVATQFHPEKSGTLGLQIYQNFVAYATQLATEAQRHRG